MYILKDSYAGDFASHVEYLSTEWTYIDVH